MKNKIGNNINILILLIAVIISFGSCSQEEIPNRDNEKNLLLNIKIDDFVGFLPSQTRAIGTPDIGKNQWNNGDKVFVQIKLYSESLSGTPLHIECLTYTYNGSSWNLSFGSDKIPLLKDVNGNVIPFKAASIQGFYNPSLIWFKVNNNYELRNGDNITEAVNEAFSSTVWEIDGRNNLTNISYTISFNVNMSPRKYSRIRVVAAANVGVSLKGNGIRPSWFIATGNTNKLLDTYEARTTTDSKGNAFFYGKWDTPTTLTFKTFNTNNGSQIKTNTVSTPAASIDGTSYEVDMR